MTQDLTNIYKIDFDKGIVKYTIKAHGNYYTGISKTNIAAGDKFDEEKGKRIAKLRAILKMKKALLKYHIEGLNWIREVAEMEEECLDNIQALTQSANNVENKLNEVLGIKIEETPVIP